MVYKRLSDIPIIFISGNTLEEEIIDAFSAGGVDYVGKPFQEKVVVARVRTHLHIRQLQEMLEAQNRTLERRIAEKVNSATASQLATIFALAKLAETRDDDTGKHIERVQTFAITLAERMHVMKIHAEKLTDPYIDVLFQTATLHDIGKVGIPDAILLKPGKLSADEFTIMKTHCMLGADTLAAVLKRYPDNEFLRMGYDVVRSHHEKWDGSGYPDGLKGLEIPLEARIVALADFYDAMTANRCYRPAFSHADTRQYIKDGRGTHFDPDVTDAFIASDLEFQKIRQKNTAAQAISSERPRATK
jgi:putative two-component system response regulator